MDMTVREENGVTQAALDGRFDIAGAQAVDSRFTELADQCKVLVVDLSNVSFIASLGVRTLMVSAKALIHRGADMAVCGANESVEKVLRSTGFDEIVSLYPDVESASTALSRRMAQFSSGKA